MGRGNGKLQVFVIGLVGRSGLGLSCGQSGVLWRRVGTCALFFQLMGRLVHEVKVVLSGTAICVGGGKLGCREHVGEAGGGDAGWRLLYCLR